MFGNDLKVNKKKLQVKVARKSDKRKAAEKNPTRLSGFSERKITLTQNSFTQFENVSAMEAFAVWQAQQSIDIDDYILRKRRKELHELVRKVIKNELCEQDRLLVSLHWYKGKSKDEIAKIIGVDRSTIFRRFEKINDILYEKLKYAVEYRYGDGFSEKLMMLVKKDVSSSGSLRELESIGNRLQRLRTEQYLSKKDVCECTGIGENRLSLIEKSGKEMTMAELKKLAAFFRVSSDYIVFGKDRLLRDENTGRPVAFSV